MSISFCNNRKQTFLSNRFFPFLLLILTIFFIFSPPLLCATIGINQIVLHPALDQTRQGIMDELKDNPPQIESPLTILAESAQGQLVIASQIAQHFKGMEVDLIVALGTTAAQVTRTAVKGTSIKVVFASVTDPLEAKLLKNLAAPEGQVTGASNFIPLKKQLILMKEILPDLKDLGILYNPGEANSVALVRKIKALSQELGLTIVDATALKTSDVPQAMRQLQKKVQAVFVTNDNTALSAFKAIVKITTEARIPLFVSDTDMVESGALAALGPCQYQLGRQTGVMIRRLIEGTPVQDIPVEYPQKISLVLNQGVATKIGVTFSPEHLKKAQRIVP